MRTESAVTTGSACKSWSSHRLFSFSAKGIHVSRETGSFKAQYACIPPPELTSAGLGKFVTLQKDFNATRASACVS